MNCEVKNHRGEFVQGQLILQHVLGSGSQPVLIVGDDCYGPGDALLSGIRSSRPGPPVAIG